MANEHAKSGDSSQPKQPASKSVSASEEEDTAAAGSSQQEEEVAEQEPQQLEKSNHTRSAPGRLPLHREGSSNSRGSTAGGGGGGGGPPAGDSGDGAARRGGEAQVSGEEERLATSTSSTAPTIGRAGAAVPQGLQQSTPSNATTNALLSQLLASRNHGATAGAMGSVAGLPAGLLPSWSAPNVPAGSTNSMTRNELQNYELQNSMLMNLLQQLQQNQRAMQQQQAPSVLHPPPSVAAIAPTEPTQQAHAAALPQGAQPAGAQEAPTGESAGLLNMAAMTMLQAVFNGGAQPTDVAPSRMMPGGSGHQLLQSLQNSLASAGSPAAVAQQAAAAAAATEGRGQQVAGATDGEVNRDTLLQLLRVTGTVQQMITAHLIGGSVQPLTQGALASVITGLSTTGSSPAVPSAAPATSRRTTTTSSSSAGSSSRTAPPQPGSMVATALPHHASSVAHLEAQPQQQLSSAANNNSSLVEQLQLLQQISQTTSGANTSGPLSLGAMFNQHAGTQLSLSAAGAAGIVNPLLYQVVPPAAHHPLPTAPSKHARSNPDAIDSASLTSRKRAKTVRGLTGRPPIPLSIEHDNNHLSPYQVLLRKQIELFETTEDEVGGKAQGRNIPILLGQVGIRCRHCAQVPPSQRPSGAVLYTKTFSGIYQISQNMCKTHLLTGCQNIPHDTKSKLQSLRDMLNRGSGGKQFWCDALHAVGVVEEEDCLRFSLIG